MVPAFFENNVFEIDGSFVGGCLEVSGGYRHRNLMSLGVELAKLFLDKLALSPYSKLLRVILKKRRGCCMPRYASAIARPVLSGHSNHAHERQCLNGTLFKLGHCRLLIWKARCFLSSCGRRSRELSQYFSSTRTRPWSHVMGSSLLC